MNLSSSQGLAGALCGGVPAARQECCVCTLRHRQTLLSTRLAGHIAICYRFPGFSALRRRGASPWLCEAPRRCDRRVVGDGGVKARRWKRGTAEMLGRGFHVPRHFTIEQQSSCYRTFIGNECINDTVDGYRVLQTTFTVVF